MGARSPPRPLQHPATMEGFTPRWLWRLAHPRAPRAQLRVRVRAARWSWVRRAKTSLYDQGALWRPARTATAHPGSGAEGPPCRAGARLGRKRPFSGLTLRRAAAVEETLPWEPTARAARTGALARARLFAMLCRDVQRPLRAPWPRRRGAGLRLCNGDAPKGGALERGSRSARNSAAPTRSASCRAVPSRGALSSYWCTASPPRAREPRPATRRGLRRRRFQRRWPRRRLARLDGHFAGLRDVRRRRRGLGNL